MNTRLPTLAAKVAFLSQPTSYPEPVRRVERVETHLSWVFLAGRHAYKLKKPLCTGFLDFRALAARRHFCREELRLNRRLAGPIYVDVVPLVIDASQQLHVGGQARPVDWLVKMRRLPHWLMLDFALLYRNACESDAARIGTALALFHQALPPERISAFAYSNRFASQIEADRRAFHDRAYGALPARTDPLCEAQAQALRVLAPVLAQRAAAGKLVEGHGDLRPEHVCLMPKIAIIDCLEFSRELRVLDKADELGYLSLECARLGAPGFALAVANAYRQQTGDVPCPRLVHFYQSCRARTRAMLAIAHVKEEKFRHSPHWRRTASSYLDLAQAHLQACQAG